MPTSADGAAVLTPYIIPPALRAERGVNVGDGFILRAVERQVGRFEPALVWSSRIAPDADALARLDQAAAVVVAGANQLNDRYTVWPGLTAERLRRSPWVVVPFGVGIHGRDEHNRGMSDETAAILRIIHERLEVSSWRCPHTVAYLEAALPDLAGRFLMTGCPVVYDRPLLDGQRFHDGEATVAVTVTERGDFWDREARTLDFVARRWPKARRLLVLHENFRPPAWWEPARNKLPYLAALPGSRRTKLRWYAASLGFELAIPASADEALALYRGVDLHVGSRLHAHLNMLSQNKRSWVTGVDGRITGMAEFLGFPVCDPARFESYMNLDFEDVRRRAQRAYETMQRFLAAYARARRPLPNAA